MDSIYRAYSKTSSKLKQNVQWQATDHPLVKCTKLPEFWRMKKSLGEKFRVRFDNNMVKDGTNVKITAGNYKNPWAELKNNEAIIKAGVAEFSDLRFCSTSGRDTKFHVYIIVDTATPITITYINAIKVTVDGPRPKRIHNKTNISKKPFEDHNIDISKIYRRKSKESTQKICELAKHHLQSSYNMTTDDRIIQSIDVNMSNSNDDSSDEQQYEQCNSPVSENLNMLADVAVTAGSDSNSISSSPNTSDKSDYECTECQCTSHQCSNSSSSSGIPNAIGTSAYCHNAYEQCHSANTHQLNNNSNIMRCRSENELYQTNLIHNTTTTYPYNMYYTTTPYVNTNYGALIMTNNHHPIVIPIKTISPSNTNTNRNIYQIYPSVPPPYHHN